MENRKIVWYRQTKARQIITICVDCLRRYQEKNISYLENQELLLRPSRSHWVSAEWNGVGKHLQALAAAVEHNRKEHGMG
jgi:hypothetical protein